MKKLSINKIVKGFGTESIRLFALYLAKQDGKTLSFTSPEFIYYYFLAATQHLGECQKHLLACSLKLQPFWLTSLMFGGICFFILTALGQTTAAGVGLILGFTISQTLFTVWHKKNRHFARTNFENAQKLVFEIDKQLKNHKPFCD